MTTTARIGSGSTFGVESAAGNATYTTLGEVTHITAPADSIDAIDVTHMGSPNATREFVMGLRDPGEVSVDMNFAATDATADFIEAWIAAREARSAVITFPNAATWTFQAIPTGYTVEVPVDGVQTASLTCKVTGSKTKS